MDFLRVTGISKRQGDSFVLKDITFTQSRSQKIAISGETGSGKTTLLKTIAGLVQPDAGIIYFEGIPVEGPDFQLVPGHPGIGYLSQHYELKNNYRVEELLEYANKLPVQEASALYEVCRIHHLVTRRTDQLSGGEKQRIALARLLVGSPKLLLLDEPYSNLDPIHKQILKSVITDISEKLSVTCLLTSHDPMDTLSWADEIIVLKDGAILQQGTPHEVYNHPVTEYTAGLFGTYYLLSATEAEQLLTRSNKKPRNGQLFIRPGNLQIVDEATGLPARFIGTVFWGTYYETGVLLFNRRFSIRTIQAPVLESDVVYVGYI